MTETRPHRYEVYEDEAGEFRWRKVAANGETTADSGESYTRRYDAMTAAQADRGDGPEPISDVH